MGQLIPVPNVQASGGLQAEIRGMKGEVALVDSVSASKWGTGAGGAGFSEYPIRRIGADPPETLGKLRREVEESHPSQLRDTPIRLVCG